MTTSEKIRATRKAAGLTLTQLADKVGVTASAISQYERGKLIPSTVMLMRIAAALNCPMQSIANDGDYEKYAEQPFAPCSDYEKIAEDPYAVLDHSIKKISSLGKEGILTATFLHGIVGTMIGDGVFEMLSENKMLRQIFIDVDELAALATVYERLNWGGRIRALFYMIDLLAADKFQMHNPDAHDDYFDDIDKDKEVTPCPEKPQTDSEASERKS